MNAQSIFSGNDYAHHDYRKKGVPFQYGAQRIRALRVYKQKRYGNERDTAYVEAFLVDNETGELRTTRDGEYRRTEVRARDISMSWENYQSELEHREAEAERKREEERQAMKARNERATALLTKMRAKGFQTENGNVTLDMQYSMQIKIRVDEMERWLNAR